MHMPQVTRLEECGRAEDVDIKMSTFIPLIRMATTAPSASGARVGEAGSMGSASWSSLTLLGGAVLSVLTWTLSLFCCWQC